MVFLPISKNQFYKDKIRSLTYFVSAQQMQIKDKKINILKNWPKPKFVKGIQVFLGFPIFINILSKLQLNSPITHFNA